MEEKAQEIIKSTRPSVKGILTKIFPFLLIILFLFLGFRFILPKLKKVRQPQEVTIVYWGLWELKEVMEPIIAQFQQEYPDIKIDYSQQYHKDYRERLQSALARGEGPDIFRFHNTWLPMFKDELNPVPAEIKQAVNLETVFYPVIKKDICLDSECYGLPLMFDCLSLFINSEIFRTAGKTAPTTWDDLRKTAIELTVYDTTGRIKTAGVALGETSNVDHWSDILGLMMLQNNVDLTNPAFCGQKDGVEICPGADALSFYSLFSTLDRVWDKTLPPSTYAFATGKVAMIFAPSWQIFNIKNVNPGLQFEVVPVPQLDEEKISWATYWVEGVNQKSQYKKEAWQFLEFLTQKDNLQKRYSQASQLRLFGEIPARTDMANLYTSNPYVAAFLEQAPYSQSWYLASRTWDNGINQKIIKYFEDAVNSNLQGTNAIEALQIAGQGVQQVLNQYQIRF